MNTLIVMGSLFPNAELPISLSYLLSNVIIIDCYVCLLMYWAVVEGENLKLW